jgi:hypothetical protein
MLRITVYELYPGHDDLDMPFQSFPLLLILGSEEFVAETPKRY